MIDARMRAAGGMASAAQRFDAAARNVARVGAPAAGTGLPPAAAVDLSTTALDLLGARADLALNAAVLRVADRMTGRLLDVTA